MKTELLLLTVLYAVACSAFIGAINARGPARVALSYFLAIITLCAAVFHTSQFMAGSAKAEQETVIVPPPPAAPPKPVPPPPPPVDTAAIQAKALADSKNDLAAAEAKTELKATWDAAEHVVKNLASLNLGSVADVSDEEYEALQNRAVSYLSEARRAKDKLNAASAKVPANLKDAQESLGKGIDALVTAAYNAERFFKSENDVEEKQHLAAFRSGSQAANAALKKAGSQLGAQDAGE